jgi:predicted metal-dependent peptidase
MSDLMSKDRMRLIIEHPFFATILLKHKLIPVEGMGTLGINGVEIKYDPKWYAQYSPKVRLSLLCHEALHVSNLHHLRKGDRNHKLFNVACDYAINQFLDKAPFELPQDKLLDPKYAGMSSERIYSELHKEFSKKKDDDQSKQEDDDDNDNDDTSDSSSDSSDPDTNNDGNNNSINQMIDDLYEKSIGEVEQHPNPQGVDESELEAETKVMVKQAMSVAKAQGKMPDGIEAAFNELLEPVVDWRSLLARWVEGFCGGDYSFSHPNPIHIQRRMIMPSLRSEAFADIAVGIDTSGSMSDKDLQQAVSEVFAGLATFMENGQEDATLKIIYCDSRVQKVETIEHEGQVTKPAGRGGTLFTPVFDELQKDPPMGMVYITDGYGWDFPKVPCCEVVWIITDTGDKHFSPPYGDVIHM